MGNWKERIEGAFRDRDKIDQGSRGVRMTNESSPPSKAVKDLETYQRFIENNRAENNLLRSGAYELLEKVRKDVWKTGSIVKKRFGVDDGARVSLQASYSKVIITGPSYRTLGGSDGGEEYVPGGDSRIKKFTDNISIFSEDNFSTNYSYLKPLYVYAGSSLPSGPRDLREEGQCVSGGKEELEEVVLGICLRWIKQGVLPPRPWYRKMFR